MKFNPLTNELFTDDGSLLKTLHCPLSVYWDDMKQVTSLYKDCSHCSKRVYDTSMYKDDEITMLIKTDPYACFKIDLNQTNLTMTYSNE
ncbi:hypothetical protein INP83_03115 [Mucilaginibacter sp. 21P]|uniref:hypothetical protein n=1 Tax=Mucilaginibacter sp. 21P TaxID=2778902 RepID=UPI001C5666BE|nr:hypothetical protein [Mucilaginibacter sp. 21P]QXV66100.1 hypothetical protein INP83_03115 [Mucilaginibacter sp. 21P]